MNVHRSLSLFCVSSFIFTGCAALEETRTIRQDIQNLKAAVQDSERPPCPFPGGIQPENTSCYYSLTITDPSAGGGKVKGKVSDKAIDRQKKDAPNNVNYPPLDDRPEFKFSVRLPAGATLTKNSDYDFHGIPNTSELSCDSQCVPRNTPIP